MSISGIGNSSTAAASLYSSVAQIATPGSDSANSSVSGTNTLAAGSQGGQLTAALMQALAQLGINTSASTLTGSSQDGVTSLIQNLAAALQSQTSGSSADPATASASSSTTVASSTQSTLETSLQNLIFQVSSADAAALGSLFGSGGSNGSSGSAIFGGSSVGGSSSTSALSSLQQSFQSLTAGQGSSTSHSTSSSLQSFLESTLQNVQGATSTGNLISTKA